MGRSKDFSSAYDAVATAAGVAVFPACRALWVGGTGDITVRMASGNPATFVAIPAGTLMPIQIDQLTAATATGIVRLY